MADIKITFDNCEGKLKVKITGLDTLETSGGGSVTQSIDVTEPVTLNFDAFFNGSSIFSGNNVASYTPPPNIDSSSEINFEINLQTDQNGNILQGVYNFGAQILYSTDPAVPPPVFKLFNKQIDFRYNQPELCVRTSVDCSAPLLEIEETSGGYEINGISPITEERLITLTPPSDITDSPQTSTSKTLYTSNFYNNVNQVDVKLDLEWELDDDIFLKDCLSFHKPIEVTCSQTLCGLLCCVENLRKKVQRAKTRNRAKYEELLSRLNHANSLITLFRTADGCTNTSVDRNMIVSEIETLTGCSCGDCGCNGKSKSQKITGQPSVPIQSKQNIKINEVITAQTSTYQNSALEGLATQDFVVFVDGLSVDNFSLNSTTGTLTFGNTLFPNQHLKIWIIS